jgi:hypothetical protein
MDNSKDLFYTDEKIEEVKSTVVPSNYIKVKLSSRGKLSAPPILHVRNYNFDEALMLADMNDTNERDIIIEVLNNLIFEDFDATLLHPQEALEILLNILGAWWSPKVEGLRYYVDETLTGKELDAKSNISTAEFPISSIKTVGLKKEVQEPITLKTKDGPELKVVVPRLQTELVAEKLTEKAFEDLEEEISVIESNLRKDVPVSNADQKKLIDFRKDKSTYYLKYYQAQLIHSYEGKKVESLEEAIDYLTKVDLTYWTQYNSILEKHFSFGPSKEVTFKCSVTEKSITRRFSFRPLDFIPTMEQENNTKFDISFG